MSVKGRMLPGSPYPAAPDDVDAAYRASIADGDPLLGAAFGSSAGVNWPSRQCRA